MHYLYRVTNLVNGKYYIGKRKHPDPANDKYMGSGKQITAAIQKYGLHNFKKEILVVVSTDEEAARLEEQLVTLFEVRDPMCYNMHRGGHGGFEHINTGVEPSERRNIKVLREKIKSGEVSVGGWYGTEAQRAACIAVLNTKAKEGYEEFLADKERLEQRNAKIAAKMRENNPAKGKSWYNDGIKSYLLKPQDAVGLKKGRL